MAKRFVTVGHVDSGKSSLCGHLLYKCGFVDEREMDKIRAKAKQDKMERWVWSRVLDLYEEEQLKGKTHEFNLIVFEHNDKTYELIDTPGHQGFVRSMIEGVAHDVNIAVVLLSMTDNEFDASINGGMLKEHLILSKAMGIEYFVILANKMDAIEWDQTKYKKRVKMISKFLTKSLKCDQDKIYAIPLCAFDGTGLMDNAGLPNWYKGKSFFATLDEIPCCADDAIVDDATKQKKYLREFKATLVVINTNECVISAGYKCNIHLGNLESACELVKIRGKQSILKNRDSAMCKFKLPYKLELYKGMPVILRKDECTVAFGKVV